MSATNVSNEQSNLSSKPNGSLYKYVFDMKKLDEYIANYDTDNAQSNRYKISEDMGCKVGVDTVIDDLYKFVTDNIEPTSTKKRPRSNKNYFPTNMWFDEECKEQRKLVNTFAKEHDISVHIYKNIYNNL